MPAFAPTAIERDKRLGQAFFVDPEDAELFFLTKVRAALLENQNEEWLPPEAWHQRRK